MKKLVLLFGLMAVALFGQSFPPAGTNSAPAIAGTQGRPLVSPTTGSSISPASSTVFIDASQFSGADIGAKANAAFASCPGGNNCVVAIPSGSYTFGTSIVIPQYSTLSCNGANVGLTYTGTGTAIALSSNTGEVDNCRLDMGTGAGSVGFDMSGSNGTLSNVTLYNGSTTSTLVHVHSDKNHVTGLKILGTPATMVSCHNATDSIFSDLDTYGNVNNTTSRVLVMDSGCNGTMISDWTGSYSGLHGLVVQNTLTGGAPQWLFAKGFVSDFCTGGDCWLFDSSLSGSYLGFTFVNSWASAAGMNGSTVVTTPAANNVHISGGKGIWFNAGGKYRTAANNGFLIDSVNAGYVTIDGNQISSSNQNEVSGNGTGPYTLTAAGTASAGATTYTGTITSGASNALVGVYFTVTGFTNAGNNAVTALCTASTTTTVTLTNANGVSETHAGTVAFVASGVMVSAMSYIGNSGYGGLIINSNTIGGLYGETGSGQNYGIAYLPTTASDVVISSNNLNFNITAPILNNIASAANYVLIGNTPQSFNGPTPSTINLVEDFLGGTSSTAGSIGQLGWGTGSIAGGAGTYAVGSPSGGSRGIQNVGSGTVANEGGSLVLGSGNAFGQADNFLQHWITSWGTVTTAAFRTGVAPPGTTAKIPVNGFYFRFDTGLGDTTIQACVSNTSVESCGSTGQTPSANTFYDYLISSSGSGNTLTFQVGTNSPVTICASNCIVTAAVPTGQYIPWTESVALSTTAVLQSIDYMSLFISGLTR